MKQEGEKGELIKGERIFITRPISVKPKDEYPVHCIMEDDRGVDYLDTTQYIDGYWEKGNEEHEILYWLEEIHLSSLLSEKNKEMGELSEKCQIYADAIVKKELHEIELQNQIKQLKSQLSQPSGDRNANEVCKACGKQKYLTEHIPDGGLCVCLPASSTESKEAVELKNPKKCSHENMGKRKGWGNEPIIYCLDCDTQLD